MDLAEMARTLGRRGGLHRARRLPRRRRADIARMGASARTESIRLAAAIRSNFDHLRVVERFYPPRLVVSESTPRRRLPGVYGSPQRD